MIKANQLLTVRAAEKRRVVTPTGAAVPDGGFVVDPRDPWWARALASGDVVELSAEEVAALEAARKKAADEAAAKAEAEAKKKAADEAAAKSAGADQGKAAAPASGGTAASAGEKK